MSQYNRRNPKSYNESYNNYNNQQRNQYSKKYEDSYEEGGYQDDSKGKSYQNNSDYHYKPKGFSNRKAHGYPENETVYVEKNTTTYVDKGRGTQISYKPKKQDSELKHSEEKIPVEASHKQESHADNHQHNSTTGTTHTEYVQKNQNQGSENSHPLQHDGNHGRHHNEDKNKRKERPPREKKKPVEANKESGQPKSQQSISSNDAGGVSSKNELDDQNQNTNTNKPQKNQRERPPRGEKKNKEYVPKPKDSEGQRQEGHDQNAPTTGVMEHSTQQLQQHGGQNQSQRRNNNSNKNKDEHGAKPARDRIKDHLKGNKERDHQKPHPKQRNQKEKPPQDGVPESGINANAQQQEEGIKPVAVERELPAFDPDDEEAVQEMLRLTSLLFESASNIPGAEEVPEGATKKGKKLEVLSSEAATNLEKVEKRGKKEKPANNNEEQKSAGLKKEEKKKPKKNPLHWACAEFNKVYHHKRNFLELYKQLEETWDEIYATVEDNWETHKFLEKTKPYYFHSFSIYVVLYFHLLIEKELFEAATDFYEQQKEMIAKETTFGPIIEDAIYELRKTDNNKGKQGGGFARSNYRARKQLPDRVGLSDFEKKLEDVVIVEKFEKFNNKHLRIEVLEKIKKEEKIAIHFAENPHMEPFISLVQIATKHEVFILDLQRICHFDDNVKLLVEFFTLTLGKKSSTIIVNDANELCEKLLKSMFIEKEQKDPVFVKLKKELCQTLDKNKNNFTDMSKLGLGKNVRELAKNVLEVNMDERERFGNWYRRPLSNEQIALSALDVLILFASYGKLFESEFED